MKNMKRWEGKVAVVTGASAGIGAAIVERFVNEGLKVVGLARRSERIEELAKKLSGSKGKLYAVKTDLSKEEDIISAFKWTTDNVGPVSILINNAGIMLQNTLLDGDTQKWKNVFDVNVTALLIATREAVRIMKKNDIAGHVVNINSQAGHRVFNLHGLNVYGATKYAVTNISETLLNELKRSDSKIRVTSISPGGVATEMLLNAESVFPDLKISDRTAFPVLQAEDVADVVAYVVGTPGHVQIQEVLLKAVGESV